LLLLLASNAGSAQTSKADPRAQIEPADRIDLSKVGYQEMSNMERLSEDESNVSLDYVDQSHVLLTFTRRGLLKRDQSCPPTHSDRMLHAVVLEVPSGKVVSEADWYLHDHRRFLWALGSGRFLLRKLNALYTLDASLQPKLLVLWPTEIAWVETTPDREQIIVATPRDGQEAKGTAEKKWSRVEIKFLDVNSLAVQRVVEQNEDVSFQGTTAGYADSVHKNNLWLVRFGANSAQRLPITRVRTRGVPRVLYAGNNALLVGRAGILSPDYNVSAFSVNGRALWHQRWPISRYFLRALHNEDNSRFAVSSLRRTAAAIEADKAAIDPSGDPQTLGNALEQIVETFETASGTRVQSMVVSPAEVNGQNVALSPDGRELAAIQYHQMGVNLPPYRTRNSNYMACQQFRRPNASNSRRYRRRCQHLSRRLPILSQLQI
jgi:hypothetical protein